MQEIATSGETNSLPQIPETDADVFEGAEEGDLQGIPQHGSIAIEKNDRGLGELHRWYGNGRLIVDPEWQRQYVWDLKRASKLIESILVDIPVPVIYLAKTQEGKYEVIDGLQRLTSVFHFFENKYTLRGLEVRKDLSGKLFKDLSPDIQAKLEDATLRTFELQPQTDKNLMFVIFERLNTGGKPLNDMEIRNCLYRGSLNDLIKKLSHDENFLQCTNQKNLSTRMLDRMLVLRALAFYERTHTKARQGLKKFINEFFENYRNPTDQKLAEFERAFSKSMRAAVTVFGGHGFRLRKDRTRGGDIWSSRLNATIFQTLAATFMDSHYDLGQITRRADSIYEAYVDLISTDKEWVDSVTAATGDYARIEYVFQTWIARLKEAVGDEQPNDKVRLFSKALKQEMFEKDPTCALCNQEIKLALDAALDHNKHYLWRPENINPPAR